MARPSRSGRPLDLLDTFDTETISEDDHLGPAAAGEPARSKHHRSHHEDRRSRRRRERRARLDLAPLCEELSEDDGDRQAVARPRARPTAQRRDDGRESFRCGHCKALVGPTISGGRHRNHCPVCLYSRHVDNRRPGDRASSCRSLMEPIGMFFKPKGEQVIVHRCRGCGFERHNRVAADDSPVALMRLPLVPPRVRGREIPVGEAAGIAESLASEADVADAVDRQA